MVNDSLWSLNLQPPRVYTTRRLNSRPFPHSRPIPLQSPCFFPFGDTLYLGIVPPTLLPKPWYDIWKEILVTNPLDILLGFYPPQIDAILSEPARSYLDSIFIPIVIPVIENVYSLRRQQYYFLRKIVS